MGCDDWQAVTLPHDAMLAEKRGNSPYGHNNGFFCGGDYVYEKRFELSADELRQKLVMEFEGSYHHTTVQLNGQTVCSQYHGSIGFYADITDLVQASNLLTVTVRNSDQPNCRWYTGSGLYRPVWLWHGSKEKHILPDGVRIRTVSLTPPTVEITVNTSAPGEVKASVQCGSKVLCETNGFSSGKAVLTAAVPGAKAWSADDPQLYTIRVTFADDEIDIPFGFRTLELNKEKGFLINGQREILRGACVHGDNGLLGACEYDFAAERKVRILKTAGYNAIRAAHNPISKAMLNACDRLGMYVLDEYTDMWYIHKNKYDDASYVPTSYDQDIAEYDEEFRKNPSDRYIFAFCDINNLSWPRITITPAS